MEAFKDLVKVSKKHRAPKSGVKAKKKSDNKKKKQGLSTERHNPKAFSVANIVRTKRVQQRNLDRAQKKELVPLVDRTEDLPPPALVVVMGPSGVGKSTLIRSLVKIYTSQNMTDTTGPITVVAGKKRRLTFFECPNDIYSMTDLAKVADLVLLLIDGSYGFEMDTFEYLNLLQLHGFPKVMGVLTHLDKFKLNKTLQKTKKALKQRFWTEIYKGAKVFEFTGISNGKYPKHEVKRLSLHISRVKFRPLVWRNTHPFVMVDRVEDVTSHRLLSDDPMCDRDVAVFGYVRGTHLKNNSMAHLVGVGDFDLSFVTALEDPCPLPGQTERLSLKTKGSLLYAPLANVGRVKMDQDGTYIDLKTVNYTRPELLSSTNPSELRHTLADYRKIAKAPGFENTPQGILRSLQSVHKGTDAGVGEELMRSGLSLFAGTSPHSGEFLGLREDQDEEEDDDDDDEDEDGEEEEEEEEDANDDENNDDYDDDDNDYDDEDYEERQRNRKQSVHADDDDGEVSAGFFGKSGAAAAGGAGAIRWKDEMVSRAGRAFQERSGSAEDLMQRVYGAEWIGSAGSETAGGMVNDDEDGDGDDNDELFHPKSDSQLQKYRQTNALDSSRVLMDESVLSTWLPALSGIVRNTKGALRGTDKGPFAGLRNKFVTGDWSKANLVQDETVGNDEEEEVYGDFEDVEGKDAGDEDGGMEYDEYDDEGEAEADEEEEDGGDVGGGDEEDEEYEDSDEEEKRNDMIDMQLQREANAARKGTARAEAAAKMDEDEDDVDGKGVGDGRGKKKGSAEEQEEEAVLEAAQRRMQAQSQRNRAEFGEDGAQARLKLEGMRQGVYCRVLLKGVPREFTVGFRPRLPVLLGGLLPHESAMGIVRARVKRHRWHKRILKSNDPLIFSVGWRRFQALPTFSIEDPNERQRFLKYTPEHMHCYCSFYGPLVPPNTGILAYQKATRAYDGFRISLTGTALELLSGSAEVMKKLKLVGTPTKVFKNTAFIKGMFNSELEVAKFEGAKIKTVSGIRGMIKKPVREGGAGAFRASFEDKILMSDIVICRLWVPVEITRYYNPVTSLLCANPETRVRDSDRGSISMSNVEEEEDDVEDERDDEQDEGDLGSDDEGERPEKSKAVPHSEDLGDWQGMRPLSQLRKDLQVPLKVSKDSVYKPIERIPRVFSKLVVPKKLQAALPFASKPKVQTPKNKDTYMAQRAVILEPGDRKRRSAIQVLHTIANAKTQKKKESQAVRTKEKVKKLRAQVGKFEDVHKEAKKRKYAMEGVASEKAAKRKRG